MENEGHQEIDESFLQSSCNEKLSRCNLKFCDDDEQYEGYGKQNNVGSALTPKCQVPIVSTESEFFESLMHAFGPNVTEILPEQKILDVLTINFSGMDRKEVCKKLLKLTQNSLQNSTSYDASATTTVAKQSLLKLHEFLTTYLKQVSEQSSIKHDKSESCHSQINANGSFNSVSSLGILDISDLSSINNDSFEGVGGQSPFQQCDTTEFFHVIEELQHQNKKLTEENTMIKTQICASEELNQVLIQENSKLKKEFKCFQETLKEMKELQYKYETLKQFLSTTENSQAHLASRLDQLLKEKELLEENIKVLGEKLLFSESDADQKTQQLKTLTQSFFEQKNTLDELYQSKSDIETKLYEKIVRCEELEVAVKELTDANQSLRCDKNLIETELERTKHDVDRLLGKQSFYSGRISSPFTSPESFLNSLTSTPVRSLEDKQSLCSEMNKVISPSENLPTPFCGRIAKSTPRKLTPSHSSLSQGKKPFPNQPRVANSTQCGKSCSSSTSSSVAVFRRKQFSKQLKPELGKCRESSKADSLDSSLENNASVVNRKLFPSERNKKHREKKVSCKAIDSSPTVSPLSQLNSFLEFVYKELQSQREYIEQLNSQAKETLKIDLDVLELEKELLEQKEESVELKIDSKAAGDSGMPPQGYSVATSERSDNKLISDLTTNDIREQINAEIKALKTQLVRSHALLSYLQENEKYSSTSCSPDLFSPKAADSQHGKTNLHSQKSFDVQTTACYHHYSHKDSISSVSRRSTPLHQYHRAQSCPTFVDDIPFASKSTQTESLHEIDASLSRFSGRNNKASLQQRYVPVWSRGKEPRFSECSSASEVSSKSAENLECGVCEVHPIAEESLSPCLPRHRTNSFLSAVVKSNNQNGIDPRHCDQSYNLSYNTSENPQEHGILKETVHIRRVVKIAHEEDKKESNKESCYEEQQKNKPSSDLNADKVKSDKEKFFKMSQRSMRRGSGAGSPNSLTSIPRYPAFDLDEQDEEHSISTNIPCPKKTSEQTTELPQKTDGTDISSSSQTEQKEPAPSLKENTRGKQDYSKAMLMPEVMENSETESAKGSFEYESSEAPSVVTEVPPIPVPDIAFPNLPDTLLSKLGISKDSSLAVAMFDEQELESKFMTLSLAFKTDKMTLSKRLEIQKRQRDIAERDAENEIKAIKDSLNYLNLNAITSETRDLIAKIQTHVDIVSLATSKISARSETYGAVKQEERVSCAFEVMMHHVENLRRLFDKEHRELEETKRMLTGAQVPCKKLPHTEGTTVEEHRKSLKTFGLAIGTVKSVFSFKAIISSLQRVIKVVRRRASVADFHQNSLQESFRSARFSQTWTSGFKDTRSRLISALSPFSSSSSVGLNSNSLSTHTCTPVVPSSQPFSQVTGSRRCSLPASSLSGSPTSSKVPENRANEALHLCRKPSEMKISVAPSLSSVADEENSEDECDQEFVDISESTNPSDVCNSNPEWNQESSQTQQQEKDVQEVTDFSNEENSNSEVSCDAKQNSAVLQRLGFPSVLHFWKETSALNLFRYLISLFFGICAFVILVITFLPSDNCSASDEHMYVVLQKLRELMFRTSHIPPTI